MNCSFYLGVVFLLLVKVLNAQEYFQQEVNYTISVRLDDSNHTLTADEEVEYINNSPDTLNYVFFHLWPNAYKNNETALGKQKLEYGGKRKFMEHPEQWGYIDSLDFRVNGKKVKWGFDAAHIDICKIYFPEPLLPGERAVITTPFYVKIPKGNVSRLGHIEESYQVTQWYPKPAVYDHKGWHPMPYLNMGEFYSEFGSFDVSISVPENYFVAATGNLQTESEKRRITEKVEETRSKKEFKEKDDVFPPSLKTYKTVRFTEENIHDFAWFADKRFHILKSEVKLPHSGRTVNTWAYFTNGEADLWQNATEYINDALYYYSLWYGDYPYDNCTAVNAPISAGGGMEYPTITVISRSGRAMPLEMVIMHEVGHNWFYGILGSNERAFPWMDEGINSFSEIRYFDTKYPDNRVYKMLFDNKKPAKFLGIDEFPYSEYHRLSYMANARRNLDIPINSHTEDFSQFNYGGVIYSKTALCFYYLKDYLGEEMFNTIMQDYFETWKYKHPYPEDLQDIFEEHSGKDLSWFFNDLLNTNKKIDYKIVRNKEHKLLIRNKGQISAPFSVSTSAGKINEEWFEGFEGKKWIDYKPGKEANSITILLRKKDPELYANNNTLKTRGIFRKMEAVEIRLLGIIEKPQKTTLNILPAAGWNYYNRFMLGAVVYNNLLPLQKFEYQVMPLYSFGSNDLAGLVNLEYHLQPYSGLFQRISFNISGRQFSFMKQGGSFYQKLGAGITFRFTRKINKKPVDNDLSFAYVYASAMDKLILEEKSVLKSFYTTTFVHSNKRKINPYSLALNINGSEDFLKSSLEFKYKYVYIYKNALDIRLFAGGFLYQDDDLFSSYYFSSSGGTGMNDYLFEDHYLARFENPSSKLYITNQFTMDGGGLSVFSPFGLTNDYLVSVNLASSLPIDKNIPVQVYLNGVVFGSQLNFPDWDQPDNFLFDGGVKLQLIRDVFEIYFPLFMTNELNNYSNDITNNYFERIRFTLNLSKLNPFELAREL